MTGSGAIYCHIADKSDLLAAATDDIIARVMTGVAGGAEPREAIRVIAQGVFDAIDAHTPGSEPSSPARQDP